MKVRIKYEKTGVMKFIGHLDMMRYFQKAIRRAGIDVAFSEGFSPHMIMSFAYPLGVGMTSSGEYFDMDLRTSMSSAEMERRLNETMADGVEVLSVRQIPDGKANKGMSLVAAADYSVEFRPGYEPVCEYRDKAASFMAQTEITILKKTKRSEQETNIRPMIYRFEIQEDKIFMQLASGSVNNLKPELVMEAFYAHIGEAMKEFAWMIHKEEIYADLGQGNNRKLVSLESLGEIIE